MATATPTAPRTQVPPTAPPTLTPTPTPTPDPDSWQLKEELDPFSDYKSVTAVLRSFSGGSELASLVVRCRERQLSLYVDWNEFLSLFDKPVTSRIGKQESVTEIWDISTSFEDNDHYDLDHLNESGQEKLANLIGQIVINKVK